MQFLSLSLTLASVLLGANAQNLTSVLSSNNETSQLASLLSAYPALVSTLSSAQNITLLAPSNNAIAALLNTTAGAALSSNPGRLQALLMYHVLQGTYQSSAITNVSAFVPTELTNTSYTNVTGGQRVQAIRVGNNVTFYSGNLQNSTVTTPNITFSGGVAHIIDRVLTLPGRLNNTLINANLTALYGALNATGLLTTLGSAKDVTIFAPNNDAFARIGSAAANLTAAQAAAILRYHVVESGTPLYSTSLRNGTLNTIGNGTITVRNTANGTFVNGAKVLIPDVLIAGGVVHVIDNVLNPANSTATADEPAFSGAVSTSVIPFTSGVTQTPTATLGGGASSAVATSTSGLAAPRMTGAVGAAALFGAGAAGAWALAF